MDSDIEPRETEKATANKSKTWQFKVVINSDDFNDEYGEFLEQSSADAATEELLSDLTICLGDFFQKEFSNKECAFSFVKLIKVEVKD